MVGNHIVIMTLATLGLLACNQHNDEVQRLQKRIDSLEVKLKDTYKPGFGEFMSSVQVHHNKLWFAGQNQNWKLADFEIHEIKETVDDIIKYQAERTESQEVDMLYPILDSVEHSIQAKNLSQFKTNFTLLTNTCNNCHRATNFEFNVVKIPESPPFSNQDFKINN
ncbi:MAG TPA: hypothetical protein VK166_03610 [Chitinophagaceae bacterium]|nr:hypothetical protein [Chitinophagaceae bacterium]